MNDEQKSLIRQTLSQIMQAGIMRSMWSVSGLYAAILAGFAWLILYLLAQ